MSTVTEVPAPGKCINTLIAELYGPAESRHTAVPYRILTLSPAFLDALQTEVAILQIRHPVLANALGRAQAILVDGRLFPEEDGSSATVLGSDGKAVYHVNGFCECPASQFREEPCKHRLALRLYQRVSAALVETAGVTPVEPARTPLPLPEAPASVNVHLTLSGRDVMITLRGHDETELLQRLEGLLTRYPVGVPTIPPPAASSWCAIHQVEMRLSTKAGKSWHSHRLQDGKWCRGK